ncbi:hypothetical protein G6F23_014829 [Rhizopus arrhizus]|nr:hypothetical protein G6F23_014829 [Rhizopus arrhizus]
MALPADGGVLRAPGAPGGDHLDAIHRTGRHAQVAARAPVGQHRVHVLVRAHDGVDRTGLDTQRTADAMGFVDARDQQRAGFAAFQVQRQDGGLQQGGQRGDAFGRQPS